MQDKPYSEMTEQERKAWFGKAFKRTHPTDVPEAYVCICEPEHYGSGYGVVAKEYDPYGAYDIDELKQYLEDYPEMNCIGWYRPLTQEQQKLKSIRTEWTSWTAAQIKAYLFEHQITKFKNDDLWEGDDIDEEEVPQSYLITYGEEHMTCDSASPLANQYDGDDDEAAAEVRALRNIGKNYIRTAVDSYYAAHHGHPEEPTFPIVYVND